MAEKQRFRGDIEGLRGVAVLLVVLGHLTGWPRGGFIGVDVFFVISGFLITGLLVAEHERTGRVSLRGFYVRRVRRLLPAGVLVLVVTDLVATLLLLPSRAHATAVDSLWALGFLANVHFAALGTDYFSITRAPSAVQHYWSLSVEEQFYLLWPALVLLTFALARRRAVAGRRVLLGVVGAVVVLSLAWSVLSTARTPAAAYFSSPARAWELGVGALLALTSRRLPAAFAWAGAAGLAVSVVVITPATHVPGYALVLPVLATAAVLGAGGDRVGLATPPLRYVGRISYSLYLWHWPCVILGAAVPGGATAAGKAALLALALALSVASYHLVEEPFRRRPSRAVEPAWRVRVVTPAYAALLVLSLVAAFVVTEPGTGRHLPSLVAQGAALPNQIAAGLDRSSWPAGLDAELVDAGAPEWLHDRCLDVSDINAARCTYGPPAGAPSVALLGDSVAVSWLPALRRVAGLRRARIHVLTRRQCPNLRGVVSPHCAQHQDWAIAAVRRLRPDLLVLSSRYEGAPTPEQWRQGTAAMLAALAPYAKRIVLLAPPPDTANLQSCFTRHSQPADCTAPVSERWRRYAGAERVAAAGRAQFVDPRPWFCSGGRCPAVVSDQPVMFDGRHLTAAYARAIAPQMAGALRLS
jgi:peptidoglycan/LPS O-acetylase OafA/YrhL